jgi:Icc-related predicted phosphoesterase
MKIVAISDTHEKHSLLTMPPGDVLVHSGDITNRGSVPKLAEFAAWLKVQDYKHKVVICGNHDFCFQNPNHDIVVNLLREAGAIYLQDSRTTIDGVNFWGAPWQPWFYDWAFNVRRGPELAKKWSVIPDDTHVLITHGPPRGILDLVDEGFGHSIHEGCDDLLNRVNQLKQLKLHIFGHLHFSGGQTETVDGKVFVNAAMVNDRHSTEDIRNLVVIEV